jgi:hypothetical protein
MRMPRTGGVGGERAGGTDARCACGSLLARVLPHGIELKCRRCRRHALVTVDPSGRFLVEGSLLAAPSGEDEPA